MNKSRLIAAPVPPAAAPAPRAPARPPGAAAFGLAAVVGAFALPLYELAAFAAHSDLYSYIGLIPAVSAFMVWLRRDRLAGTAEPRRGLAAALVLAGVALLGGYVTTRLIGASLTTEDRLAFTTAAFLCVAAGVVAWFVGRAQLAALAFPIGFLAFMIPVPTGLMDGIETLMQHGSAAAARGFFQLAGTPVFYERLNFQLPGINLHVAPECSGIRSTIALTIVSAVTGCFFLRSPVKRTLLVAAVVPLALLRNGLRIFVVGELCVRFGPQMIDSYLHRRGGPIFFALSLVPFFLLVFLLQDRQRGAAARAGARRVA